MRLLVLGGTKFLGRAIVEEALARGHEVTLFNRGTTNPELFPEVEKLRGDRDGDLRALAGRRWDAVVDPSGYVPRIVRASAELLRESSFYVFVSSVSVYAEPLSAGFDESAPTIRLDDPTTEDFRATPEAYGGLKALCEDVVREVFADRHANVRAGLIVGPHDPTDRFTYWPLRAARGGQMLAPAPREREVQFVDVRDLGAWIVRLAEGGVSGTFNATCPPLPMGELLETCRDVSGSGAELVWVDEDLLLEHGVGPWMELPLWLPATDAALLQADVSRAVAAGLTFRPIADTVRDTLEWARGRDDRGAGTAAMGGTAGVGLAPERERELLAAWRSRAAVS